ncbi:HNH endonuclease [Paenibacillus macquariensis]|uniref:HNH endonuclease n=1 Tax=Paenibacillus macquariensis TaxID=948756 RepID=A0ABY1KDM9_9BACL|nr:HNH endonuclease [Paenibacillus macquariensis]OAB27371.1 hypothetical protein PMSM_25500 [Paenibacillus macquariensis subsp. macquariensis]SIR66312.1 hypothetical protein SAMN05421578_12922 [Paenibacillus macquariensis]
METRFIGDKKKAKIFDIKGPEGSVQIVFRHTKTEKSDKMIVDTVDYGQGPTDSWSEHGQLKELLMKFTGETFEDDRDPWLRSLFYSHQGPQAEFQHKGESRNGQVNRGSDSPTSNLESSELDQHPGGGYTLTINGPTDKLTVTKRRVEHPKFRRILGLNNGPKQCAICGNLISPAFLVAAHIKKRALASDDERKDTSIVVPMCHFGCDALFEEGLIAVHNGSIIRNKAVTVTDYVNSIIQSLIGKEVPKPYWGPLTEKYFSWHLKYHRGES